MILGSDVFMCLHVQQGTVCLIHPRGNWSPKNHSCLLGFQSEPLSFKSTTCGAETKKILVLTMAGKLMLTEVVTNSLSSLLRLPC